MDSTPEPASPEPPVHISADEARGGEIVLPKGPSRAIFVAGLVLMCIVVALIAIGLWR